MFKIAHNITGNIASNIASDIMGMPVFPAIFERLSGNLLNLDESATQYFFPLTCNVGENTDKPYL